MKKNRKAVSFVVLALSILFIGIGLMEKEHLEVLQKAVRICLECIGIG
ncbi:MAG: hypothetical protein HFI63_02310 [Lachnospiraceae bacterium]|nr:hypothetical protein [Lachnospiraceae bacterium]